MSPAPAAPPSPAPAMDAVLAAHRGWTITCGEFLQVLESQGLLSELIGRVVRDRVLRDLARQRGLAAESGELQRAADAIREREGLHSAEETRRWLTSRGMSLDDLERLAETEVLERRLQEQISPALVESHFERLRPAFDRVRLCQIVVESPGLADELAFRIREEGADFAELARRHSVDEATRDNAGYAGLVPRNGLPEEAVAAVFKAHAGEVLGPFRFEGTFRLFQVREVLDARLDERCGRQLRRAILDDLLEALSTGVTRLPLRQVFG